MADQMNKDACYLLANATELDQERVLSRAVEYGKERDKQSKQNRQSSPGQITSGDMKKAINDERYLLDTD